jgi:DnaA family protein
MKQQIFKLKLPEEKTFQNYFGSANLSIVRALQSLDADSLYLWGNPECGITHLLQATCLYWQQHGWYVLYLDMTQATNLQALFEGALEGIQLLAIDNVEAIAGKKTQEESLFYLFNRGMQTSFSMIWGAHHTTENTPYQLKDFASRLQSSLIFHVPDLNDQDKKFALQSHAQQRGFALPDEVVEFLLKHYPRTLPELFKLLDKLDQASLQEHRRLTIPFVKKFTNHV